MAWARALLRAVRRLRWPLLALLAGSFLIMLVEIAISDYEPEPDGPLELIALLLGGTIYIFFAILVFVAPFLVLTGITWFLVSRARSKRAERREGSSE